MSTVYFLVNDYRKRKRKRKNEEKNQDFTEYVIYIDDHYFSVRGVCLF